MLFELGEIVHQRFVNHPAGKWPTGAGLLFATVWYPRCKDLSLFIFFSRSSSSMTWGKRWREMGRSWRPAFRTGPRVGHQQKPLAARVATHPNQNKDRHQPEQKKLNTTEYWTYWFRPAWANGHSVEPIAQLPPSALWLFLAKPVKHIMTYNESPRNGCGSWLTTTKHGTSGCLNIGI